jgi:hypothetical protein
MKIRRPAAQLSAAIAAVAVSITLPAVAAADAPVHQTLRSSPVSAYKGTIAWSKYDAVKNQYRLMLTTAKTGKTTMPNVAWRFQPFDVTLGPDSNGKTVALYSRCNKSDGTGCDAWRYSLADKKEVKLGFNSDEDDEGWPSQWFDQFAWVEVRGYGTAYQTDPDSRCDRPLSKAVEGNVVKLNAHGSCGSVTGQVVRGKTIAQTVNWNQQGADGDVKKYSELRLVPAKGGVGTRIAISKFYQGGSDILSSPQIDDKYVYAVRSGVGVPSQFVRFPRNKGKDPKGVEVDALTPLAGPMARDGSTAYYLEGLPGDQGSPLTACSNIRPCRLMKADPSVFGSGERRLAPRLTFGMPPFVLAPQPLTLTGSLTVPVVKQGKLVRTEPLAGVALQGLQATDLNGPNGETVRLGQRTAVTAADGSWTVTVAPPLPLLGYYAATTTSIPAVTQSPLVKLKADAVVTLTATPSGGESVVFAGTVDPVQPGRSVRIQRRLGASGATEVLGDVPLSPDGRSFSLSGTAAPGTVVFAELPENPFDGQDGDATITGTSPDVVIPGP